MAQMGTIVAIFAFVVPLSIPLFTLDNGYLKWSLLGALWSCGFSFIYYNNTY